MAEEQMVEMIEAALRGLGDAETVVAAGQFMPRGHTGSMFVGGIIGDSVGGSLGGLGDAVATTGGSLAGAHAHDAATGLPGTLLVGVTATHVYGFDSPTRHGDAGALVFRVPRDGLDVEVHQRVNVRILELIDTATGSRIELEGSRVPLTHSKDVIAALQR
ncbi:MULTISPECIES: hypothetical protein [unclassified Nocardioides]|uniref:hypothetical protein n=1 Tax=unclassified Nocardioides TaxID=2615069 RepID=UPI003607FA7E